MPAWIHERAEHLLAKNPDMKKSTAFAVATQQSHRLGKTPKGYGTAAGKREAKKKYDKPKKSYVKGANPGDLETPKLTDRSKTKWTGSKLVKKGQAEFFGGFSELFKLAFKPVGGFWKARAGFTPAGMKTPTQKLKKSMEVGKYKPPKMENPPIKVAESEEVGRLVDAATIGAGGAALVHSKPLITGRTRLYHGTTPVRASKIKQEGLVPAGGKLKGVTEVLPPDIRGEAKSLVYLTKSKPGARYYAAQAQHLAPAIAVKTTRPNIISEVQRYQTSPEALKAVMNPFGNKGVVTADVPLWKKDILSKLRKNPEARGSFEAFRKAFRKALGPALFTPEAQIRADYNSLNKAIALKGGLPSEYIKGGKDYRGVGSREIKEYVRAKPWKFIGGVGLAGLGAAGLGIGGYRALTAKGRGSSESATATNLGHLKEAYATSGGYLHSQVGKPKLRPKSAAPPSKDLQVKAGEIEDVEFGDETDEAKYAFTESQYSGGLGPGRFIQQASYIPPFRDPPLSKSGGPAAPKGKVKKAAGLTPAGLLRKSQRVGAPKASAPPGPSIADISKPIGFGRKMPGATKTF